MDTANPLFADLRDLIYEPGQGPIAAALSPELERRLHATTFQLGHTGTIYPCSQPPNDLRWSFCRRPTASRLLVPATSQEATFCVTGTVTDVLSISALLRCPGLQPNRAAVTFSVLTTQQRDGIAAIHRTYANGHDGHDLVHSVYAWPHNRQNLLIFDPRSRTLHGLLARDLAINDVVVCYLHAHRSLHNTHRVRSPAISHTWSICWESVSVVVLYRP